MFNLLREPLIRAVGTDGVAKTLSLPESYAALAGDRIARFPALRPHQAPAWHAFLVQAGAMGAEASDLAEAPGDDPEAWAQLLRALTPDHPADEPWHLAMPPEQPAFLQPPVPGGDLSGFGRIRSPDALDLLITSKNHDLKAERMAAAEADDWIFALLSLQTQEGFLGAGNYGIARMNGGFGSRPYMRFGPTGGGFGAQVMRDLRVLIQQRDDIARAFGELLVVDAVGSIPLVWVEPWDGLQSLTLAELHPLFIESCRRIRLLSADGRLEARAASSKAARIAAKDRNGVLDDPWGPVEKGDATKLLTITSDGFSYRKVTELLFGSDKRKYDLPRLARPAPDETARRFTLHLQALARGQGKTEGFHQREIELSPGYLRRLQDEDAAAAMAARARERVRQAGTAQGKALRPALIVLTQKGPEQPAWTKPSNDSLVGPTLQRFDQLVDEAFFPALWASLDQTDEAAALVWVKTLADFARTCLSDASEAAPRSGQRRVMALARARNVLDGALVKQFPQLLQQGEARDVA